MKLICVFLLIGIIFGSLALALKNRNRKVKTKAFMYPPLNPENHIRKFGVKLWWKANHEAISSINWINDDRLRKFQNLAMNNVASIEDKLVRRAGQVAVTDKDSLSQSFYKVYGIGKIEIIRGATGLLNLNVYREEINLAINAGPIPLSIKVAEVLNVIDAWRSFEILQFLLSEENLRNNDLRKIRSLSGVFKTRNGHAIFSGMIKPGQVLANAGLLGTFIVISCFHGLRHFLNDNSILWFQPYGPYLNNRENEFRVVSFRHMEAEVNLEELNLADNIVPPWANFNEDLDYVEFRVRQRKANSISIGGIRNIVSHFLTPNGLINQNTVVNLRGMVNTNVYTSMFAFGSPSYNDLKKEEGFLLVSNIISYNNHGAYKNDPYRAFDVNRNQDPDCILAVNMPLFEGMSGGPVVECEFTNNSINCILLGIVSGGGLKRASQRGPLGFKGKIATNPGLPDFR